MFPLKKAISFFLISVVLNVLLWAEDKDQAKLQDYYLTVLKKDYALYLKNKDSVDMSSNPNMFLLSVLTSRCTLPQGRTVALIELINPALKGYFEYEWAENPYSGNLSWISKTISGFHYSDGVNVPQPLMDLDDVMALNQDSELDVLVSKTMEAASRQNGQDQKYVRGSDHSLLLYGADEQYIACHKGQEDSIVLSADDKSGVRRFYDSRMRLSKMENWHKDSDKGFVLDSTNSYSYEGENSIPLSCVSQGENFRKTIEYNGEGKVISTVLYEKEKVGEDIEDMLKKEVVNWVYDENGKVIQKESWNFTYRNESRKLKYSVKRKEVYEYKVNDWEPDYFYFEDDKLRLSTVHTSDVDFITTSIFDSGFTVESYYEGGIHKKDVFLVNGVVRRSASYE